MNASKQRNGTWLLAAVLATSIGGLGGVPEPGLVLYGRLVSVHPSALAGRWGDAMVVDE
jgi:hypothetical protein